MANGSRDEFRAVNNIPDTILIPKRIFVGRLPCGTKEEDLKNLFSKYGYVKYVKVLFETNRSVTTGYGFVTFETEDEAQKVIEVNKIERLVLKGRKLNIAPAFKKQPVGNKIGSNPPVLGPFQSYLMATSAVARDPWYYSRGAWPSVEKPQFHLNQQYCYPLPPPQVCSSPIVYPMAIADYPYQIIHQGASSDYSEMSADIGESVKNRPKLVQSSLSEDYDRGRHAQSMPSEVLYVDAHRYSNGNGQIPTNCMHSYIPYMHPVFAKTINGITVVTYPNPVVINNPAVIHIKDGSTEAHNVLSDLGFLHPSAVSGALTPPPTPLVPYPCDFNVNPSTDDYLKK
ncbi:protein boule-like [Trichonephila clavata]|uniref:Protein boule-like n=1 Tax=Trichonephila clavata TaxID=2740835 RepID=A0A8X6GRE8_TRICU|nr:protein boule-like [Trichonephila clavata]